MKKIITLLLAVVFGATLGIHAANGDGQPYVPTPDEVTPGFYGHPLLAKYGYKAENGVFNISVGQGAVQNIDNLTDDDATNAGTTAGLAALTVALDQLVMLKPDSQSGIATKTYKSGTSVGFVISTAGADVSVLDVDVVKMCAIYFYKGDEQVAVVNGSNGELDVLNLNVISFGLEKETQKLTAECPKDDEGNDIEFDGIGFGFAGVNIGVGKDIAINYGFVDDFVEVPLIKKYYPDLTSKTTGMVSGAKNLINNDLEDGATTAVLNIGGAYYDVLNDEPFPAGIEVGFAMTSGSLLDLNLGKAIRIKALTYPTDADGNFLTDQELVEVDITTQVNVIGLELIGGGKSVVTMMPSVPFFGLRLERISVLDLDLGATVVHYAYVKLPAMPDVKLPVEIGMDVVPVSTFSVNKSTDGVNTYANKILLETNPANPVLTKEKFAELYPSTRTPWQHGIIGCGWPWTDSNDYICLTLTRKDAGEETVAGYLYIIKASTTHSTAGVTKDKYYCQFDKKGTELGEKFLLSDPVDGIIDLHSVCLAEDEHKQTFANGAKDSDIESAFRTVEYTLYFPDYEKGSGYADDIENAVELDYDEVCIPAVEPEYELAGCYDEEFLRTNDDSYVGKNSDDIVASKHGEYIIVELPDRFDWKTMSRDFDVYRFADKKLQKSYTVSRNESGDWYRSDNMEVLNTVRHDGITRILLGVVTGEDHRYSIVCKNELTREYIEELTMTHGKQVLENGSREYGWYPSDAPERILPEFEKESEIFTPYHVGAEHVMATELFLNLNDAQKGHMESNGELLYNQWSTVSPMTRAAVTGQDTKKSVVFNEVENPEWKPVFEYPSENGATHHAVLFSAHENLDAPYNYAAEERAYIPVVPSGFDGAVAPSYLVVENNHAHDVEVLTPSSVMDVEYDAATEEAEFYNLQGIKVMNPSDGIYLMRQGAKVTKVYLNN